MAIVVPASATAVFCTSVPLKPGGGFEAQAASAMTITKETTDRNFLFIFSPLMDIFITKT
jgi:hypothetical protein